MTVPIKPSQQMERAIEQIRTGQPKPAPKEK